MVADLHVAALRALLSYDADEHVRLFEQIEHEGSAEAYGLFFKVVFERAVWRKFGPRAMRNDVIRFVADVRAKLPKGAEDFDPLAAERLLRGMLGDQKALQSLTAEDTALMGPLLLELAGSLTAEEMLLAEAQERLETTVA
jgi:hypothetical protein